MYRGKSQPKDGNYHFRSPSHPLGKDLHSLLGNELRFVVRASFLPPAAKYRCFNLVIDTCRTSPDTATALQQF